MTHNNLEQFINNSIGQMMGSVDYAIEHKNEDRGFNWNVWVLGLIDEKSARVFGVLQYLHNYNESMSAQEYDLWAEKIRTARRKARELAMEKLL